MKNKDKGIYYKLFILGVLVLLNLFIIYNSFSSNPIFEALLGHIPFLFILLPSSILTFILIYTTYKSVKDSKTYSKNFYINSFLSISFVFGLLILVIFTLFFLFFILLVSCPT